MNWKRIEDNEWGATGSCCMTTYCTPGIKEEDFEAIQDFLPEGKLEIRQDEWPEFLKKKLSPITHAITALISISPW